MKLSVIIVNYNVKAYLEQCLRTVSQALEGMPSEVFVVDNQSTDGSVEMVRERFPKVKLIANTVNVGFSRANNQAIKEAQGEYVLLLNPDTVVGEDVFHKVVAFLDSRPQVGGLGVKMIDGTGRFLPESKRGLPTPQVAFFKIIGLTRLFPRSKVFGRYHLGHLPENEPARIEILSGACMFLRKRTLDEVGLLDESFFMYGEDIDLSYRITLGGYENWYYPEARIIHYKGESTKKSSVNYVFVFYNAMAIFARKHFSRRGSGLFAAIITASIYLSAAGAIVTRFLRRALLPMLDVLLFFALYALYRWVTDGSLPLPGKPGFVLGVSLAGVMSAWLCGGYDIPVKLSNVFKSALLLAIAAMAYSFFGGTRPGAPSDMAPAAWLGLIVMGQLAARLLLHTAGIRSYSLRKRDRQRVLAIGSPEEAGEALALLWQTHFGLGRQAQLSASEANAPDGAAIIRRKVRELGMDEVVFCARDLRWGHIIELLEKLRHTGVTFKVAQPGCSFIIGANSIESLQDLHVLEQNSVKSGTSRRGKRTLDVSFALLMLLTFPLSGPLSGSPAGLWRNIFRVLGGRATWVGYHPMKGSAKGLPVLPPAIIDAVEAQGLPARPDIIARVNIVYAKYYSLLDDLRWMLKRFRLLGKG